MLACPYCAETVERGTRVCPHCRSELDGPAARGAKAGRGVGFWIAIAAGAVVLGVTFVGVLVAILIAAVDASRQAAQRSVSANNLRELGLAAMHYGSIHKSFPPPSDPSRRGAAPHSWATYMLAGVDRVATYRQVDFDKTWDDPANAAAFQTRIPTFWNPACADRPVDGRGYALSHYAGNVHLFPREGGLRYDDVTDGLHNTVLFGEAADGFRPWGDPDNLRDPASGLGGGPAAFGSPWREGVQLIGADVAVHYLSRDTSPEVLQALATPAGNERIQSPE